MKVESRLPQESGMVVVVVGSGSGGGGGSGGGKGFFSRKIKDSSKPLDGLLFPGAADK